MKKSDLKYLWAYIIPLTAWVAIYYGGYLSALTFYWGFVIVPFLEMALPASTKNHTIKEEEIRNNTLYFDVLLYSNLPIVWATLFYFFYKITTAGYGWSGEMLGWILSLGLLCGTIGINVAHEIGHRDGKFNRWVAKLLLLPSFYCHFTVEHNYGHHKMVSTPEDPSSSRLNEPIYFFWLRSVSGVYTGAWQIESDRLKKDGIPFWSFNNDMIINHILYFLYAAALVYFGGWFLLSIAIPVAIIGFLLLESVNYIEHYGLVREKMANGRYEAAMPIHSWNSNHELGRIILYELTRHSDHHYKANRKYQVLRHFEESPQLPTGYPGSILMAIVPPVWFRVMNPRLKKLVAEK